MRGIFVLPGFKHFFLACLKVLPMSGVHKYQIHVHFVCFDVDPVKIIF